ncbi:response regulator [Chitinophaga pinensis]|uniref:Response regulator receiver protein n=1 Tax=Chitinophaga pinensis (strain ATCC 43595 / DSM 2588 / LMG 13176 / NBRC 15968 / NCIMB 11800 / UQM 2034) TaxID=485918 RepID=A0A979G5R4_CHIPD|nr:response regulator [Chitinophaga pinensis]ACU61225.1 response regulator receiver protein [Chitinophaga pinensis DSM 2588]
MDNTVKILLADDDLEDRFIMQDAFNAINLPEVPLLVEDGEKVLEYLSETQRNAGVLPSLVVLDLNMPRLSGTQTLRELKSRDAYKDIPVIIFSSSLNVIEMHECKQLGALSYMVKPFTYEEYLLSAQHFYDFCIKKRSFPEFNSLINNFK